VTTLLVRSYAYAEFDLWKNETKLVAREEPNSSDRQEKSLDERVPKEIKDLAPSLILLPLLIMAFGP